MSPHRVVEALEVAEEGHAGLRPGVEAPAGEEFAFQGREEALGHGVVVGVTDRAHRRPHTRLAAAAAGRPATYIASPDPSGGSHLAASSGRQPSRARPILVQFGGDRPWTSRRSDG